MTNFIETLNQSGEQFLKFAGPVLWQSSLLIAVVFVLEFALRRKVRAAIRYALWLMVLVKLLLPPSLALPTSPSWWIHPSVPPPPKTPPVSFTVSYGEQVTPDFPLPPAPVIPPPKAPAMSVAAWTLAASGFASAGLLAWLLVRWRQINQKVRRAKTSEKLIPVLDEARRLIRLRPGVRLKLTEDSMSPAVCGLFRPVILLPQSLVEKLSAEQLRAVLLHEAVHLRRGDVWVNCAQALLQIVYWWHPLLWLANARIRRVREEAVDDAVMLALRDDAEIYPPTLLEVAKLAFNRPLASLGLVGILESRSALRQRIERLMDFHAPRKAGLTVVSILGILAFSAVALPMGQAPEKTNEPTASLQDNSPISANAPKDGNTARVDTNTVVETLLDPKLDGGGTNANPSATNLETRIFKVDAHTFPAGFLGYPANSVPTYGFSVKDLSKKLGVDLTAPGRSVVYNDGLGLLMVNATPSELNTIERIVQAANQTAPQIHSKARFIEVSEVEVEGILKAGTAVDTNTAIIINADKMKTLLRQLESASGVKTLAEPESLTASWRHVQMRSTNSTVDLVPTLLEDGYTLNLATIISKPETRISRVNIWEGQTLALVLPRSDGKKRLVILVTSWLVDPAGNRVHSDDELRQMQEKAKSDIPPQHTLILSDPKFRATLHALEQRTGTETLAEPVAVSTGGRQVQLMSANYVLQQTQYTSVAERDISSANLTTFEFEIKRAISENDLKELLLDEGVKIPPTVLLYEDFKNYELLLVRGSKEQTALVFRVVLKLNGASPKEAERNVNDFVKTWPTSTGLNLAATNLEMRVFKVDPNTFAAGLRGIPDLQTNNVATMVQSLVSKLGTDLSASGRSIVFLESSGRLFVKATPSELDTIEIVIQTLNQATPQIHIKARFIEVKRNNNEANGFDWYLGNLTNGPVVANGRSASSPAVPVLAANPPGSFPSNAATAQMTGILSDPNFRVVLHALEQRAGVETLAEPECVTISGRQVKIFATEIWAVVTNSTAQENASNSIPAVPKVEELAVGPAVEIVPHVLSDGYTINLKAIVSVNELRSFENTTNTQHAVPSFAVQKADTTVNLWDGQTLVLGNLKKDFVKIDGQILYNSKLGQALAKAKENEDKELFVFITATIVDPAGNRVHSDDEMRQIQETTKSYAPPQPPISTPSR